MCYSSKEKSNKSSYKNFDEIDNDFLAQENRRELERDVNELSLKELRAKGLVSGSGSYISNIQNQTLSNQSPKQGNRELNHTSNNEEYSKQLQNHTNTESLIKQEENLSKHREKEKHKKERKREKKNKLIQDSESTNASISTHHQPIDNETDLEKIVRQQLAKNNEIALERELRVGLGKYII